MRRIILAFVAMVIVVSQPSLLPANAQRLQPAPGYWTKQVWVFKQTVPDAKKFLTRKLEQQIGTCLSKGKHPENWVWDKVQHQQIVNCMNKNFGYNITLTGKYLAVDGKIVHRF